MCTRVGSVLLWALCISLASCSAQGRAAKQGPVLGSGATFPAPLYAKWTAGHSASQSTGRLSYEAIGSGAGFELFKEGKVDFAGSDVVPTEKQLQSVGDGVQLIPMAAGNIVVCYHLPEVKENLKLSREALAGIFLGTITSWDDPKIAEPNKHLTLPNTKTTVVHRSGASGTTFVFTQHLSLISDEWKKGPGAGLNVNWPTGKRAMGNDGVAEIVKQTPGAIGYVSMSAATKNQLPMAALQNKAKEFITPSEESGKAALATALDLKSLRDWVPDADGKGSYPIVTFSWIVARKHYNDPRTAGTLKEFLKYGLTEGQKDSAALGYIPLPAPIVDRVLPEVDKIGS